MLPDTPLKANRLSTMLARMRLLVALVALLQLQTSLCFTGPFTGGSQLLSLGLRSGNGLVGARSDVPRLRSGAKTAVSMADDIGDKKKWQVATDAALFHACES
eukprot:519312-Rhodomonas_salina.3